MIDLETHIGPVTEKFLVMVKENDKTPDWHGPYNLVGITKDDYYKYCVWFDDLDLDVRGYKYAKIYTPPKKRPMTHIEIFKALHNGAILKSCYDEIGSVWTSKRNKDEFQISYDWGETWEPLEVEA